MYPQSTVKPRYIAVILYCALMYAMPTQAQVAVNELMPIPLTGEPEWVELYNHSDKNATLDSGWIHDLRTAVRLPQLSIPARGYAILARDTFALRESREIPKTAVLAECKLPSLNNTTDAVVLRGRDSSLIDSVFYSMKWGRRGISLERKRADSAAVSEANWFVSESPDSATIGWLNSITPIRYDARAKSIAVNAGLKEVRAVVENYGLWTLDSVRVQLYADADGNGISDAGELAAEAIAGALKSGEFHETVAPFETLSARAGTAGSIRIIAVCNAPDDGRRRNDTLRRDVFLPYPAGSVRINEILFEPSANYAEYIEVINTTDKPLNLGGWAIHDRPGVSGADTVRFAAPLIVPPRGYAVIATDSSLFLQFPLLNGSSQVSIVPNTSFNLNADGDVVVLLDPNGGVADSLVYSAKWHSPALVQTKGVSLEKISPALPSSEQGSWSSCGAAAGGTPLAPNSIAVELRAVGAFEASPNPFVLSTAANAVCLLSYSLPYRTSRLTISVFTRAGQPVKTLANGVFTASEGNVVWDGRDNTESLVPTGAYAALLEAVDTETGEVYRQKTVIVVGN